MPLTPLRIRPGINVQATPTLNEGGWSYSGNIRFKDGLPQKVGGWVRFDEGGIVGLPRALHAFADLNGNNYLAIGTEQRLQLSSVYGTTDISPAYAITNRPAEVSTVAGSTSVTVYDYSGGGRLSSPGDWVDIVVPISVGGIVIQGLYVAQEILPLGTGAVITAASPAVSTVSHGGVVPKYNVTAGSAGIIVDFPNHGLTTGDTYEATVPTPVGGLIVSGTYTVTVTDANTFTIISLTIATETDYAYANWGASSPPWDTDGAFWDDPLLAWDGGITGNMRIRYLLPNGFTSAPAEGAYGVGVYGYGPYGVGYSSAFSKQVTYWSLDNWGEQLIANRSLWGIYAWIPPISPGNVAQQITGAPLYANGIFVSMPARILVALAAESGGVQDPLLVRWSDVEDYNDWTATTINQAGSYRLSTGSYIAGGLQTAVQAYIWTDIGLWTMRYIGLPFVFSFIEVGRGCGLIAPHAFARLDDRVFWMGQNQFYMVDSSGVQNIPCTVWDDVFKNLSAEQVSKITAGANSYFNEIVWFYPSADGLGENDRYVRFNIDLGVWDYGSIERTAWIDQSVLGAPLGADSTPAVYQHEVGNNADGAPIAAMLETGFIEIAEGDRYTFVDFLIPDVKFGIPGSAQDGTVMVTVYMTDYPFETPRSYGPFPFDKTTKFVNPRARGRQMALKIESTDLNSFWRVGDIRYRGAQDGRR